MSTAPISSHEPTAVVNAGLLYITNVTENDTVVVQAVENAENGVAEVQRLLRLGAQVDRLAGTTLDAEVMEGTALRLVNSFDGTVNNAVKEIADNARKIFDPADGALPAALTEFRGGLEKLLGEKFDPDSRKSIIGAFDDVIQKGTAKQEADFARLLDPTNPDGPIGKWQADYGKTVKLVGAEIKEQVRELSERIAVNAATEEATKAMINKTTGKGFTFEDTLHALVESTAVGYQDFAVQTGRTQGAEGTQRGDEVVSINPEETRGLEANIVWECKDKKLGAKKILDELDDAMKNRCASVGIAVFASQAIAPITVPFATYGNKAIVVLDKEDPDPLVIRFAHMWGRWVAKRDLSNDDVQIDTVRIEALIDEARRALQRVTQIKKHNTQARNSIDAAGEQVAALADQVEQALRDLDTEITKAA